MSVSLEEIERLVEKHENKIKRIDERLAKLEGYRPPGVE